MKWANGGLVSSLVGASLSGSSWVMVFFSFEIDFGN
jgi:hypothetical protein